MNCYSLIEKTDTMLADYYHYFSDLTINYVISFSKELMQKIEFQLLQLTLLLTSRNAICVVEGYALLYADIKYNILFPLNRLLKGIETLATCAVRVT